MAYTKGIALARAEIERSLEELLANSADPQGRIRALWTLHILYLADWVKLGEKLLKDRDEYVRGWAIQLISENRTYAAAMATNFARLARDDRSPVVRRFLASALQRLPVEQRHDCLQALLRHSQDVTDPNLPLMYWFAMEPLVADQPKDMLTAALETKLPQILNFTTRRIASLGTSEARDLITEKLRSLDDAGQQLDMLAGFNAALKGQRRVQMPKGWEAVEAKLGASPNAGVRTLAQTLSLTFGSPNALEALRMTLSDATAPAGARRAALDSLVSVRDAELPQRLSGLLQDAALRGPALRALAGFNDPNTPDAILAAYASFEGAQRRDALNTLVSRPAFAKALLTAVIAGQVPVQDLTADLVRQLRGFKDPDIQQHLARAYGAVRESSADKKVEIEKYRNIYRAGYSQPGDASRGRVLFNKVCAQCHTLFDSGGKVGPDITGANRTDLNYLLETVLDPNAVIPNEYRSAEIETQDGRSLTGIVKAQDDKTVTLQTVNESLILPTNEIASQRQTELSMMPEGLLSGLTDQEVRDLIYYLTRLGQVPLPAGSEAK
jgi:putative heme-binding domain-containing protein